MDTNSPGIRTISPEGSEKPDCFCHGHGQRSRPTVSVLGHGKGGREEGVDLTGFEANLRSRAFCNMLILKPFKNAGWKPAIPGRTFSTLFWDACAPHGPRSTATEKAGRMPAPLGLGQRPRPTVSVLGHGKAGEDEGVDLSGFEANLRSRAFCNILILKPFKNAGWKPAIPG